MNLDNKKLIIATIILSIIFSSFFGAGASFIVISSGLASNENVKDFWEKIWPNSFLPKDNVSDIFNSEKKILKVEEESAVTQVVERVSPAVVSIIITKDLPKIERYYSPFRGDDFFGQFFGDDFLVPRYRQDGTEKQEIGGGTGFIITSEGYVATNKHVISDETASYTVLLNDERKFDAKILARDPVNDVAFLKIEASNLPTVELGDSSALKVGQTVIAIGNALGEFRNTVSAGVVSGLSRSIIAGSRSGFVEELANVIQTDAAINSGNSGGPLLNIAGQVVGINTAVAQGAQGIGFAIPINEVKNSIESVKEKGRIVRPWIGVRYLILNEQIARENNFNITEGALIVRGEQRTDLAVIPGSPADRVGLVENDIILEVDGVKVNKENSLAKIILKHQPGDEIQLKIWRKGDEKMVKVILGEYGE